MADMAPRIIFYHVVPISVRYRWNAFRSWRENAEVSTMAPGALLTSGAMRSLGDTWHFFWEWRDFGWNGSKNYFLPCCANQYQVHMKFVYFKARKCRGQHNGTMIVPDKWSNEKYRRHTSLVLRMTLFWVVLRQELFFAKLCQSVSGTHEMRFVNGAKIQRSAQWYHNRSWQVEQWEV